jgi:hypothetical protein
MGSVPASSRLIVAADIALVPKTACATDSLSVVHSYLSVRSKVNSGNKEIKEIQILENLDVSQ